MRAGGLTQFRVHPDGKDRGGADRGVPGTFGTRARKGT
jgi:hypothetical protein